jgi:hypothetical protein
MNQENVPEMLWTETEETLLMLARELEWAEAYAQDHPNCSMGRVYFDFLRWEMVRAQGEI